MTTSLNPDAPQVQSRRFDLERVDFDDLADGGTYQVEDLRILYLTPSAKERIF